MISFPAEQIVAEFRPPFIRAISLNNIHLANLIAMEAAALLFEHDAANARLTMWSQFSVSLAKQHYRAQYQSFDFEVVDYGLYRIPQSWSLLRGPKPKIADIASGRYLTFFGAAQLFGRYQSVAPPTVVAESFGLACLNMSTGGSGPESFIDDETVKLANGGKAVVLQVLSGRSVGCDEYPGTRKTFDHNDPNVKIDRLKLLRKIWEDSHVEAKRIARKWQRNYVEMMRGFLARIEVPVVLAWISSRAADDWSVDHLDVTAECGDFPQLVDGPMLRELVPLCAELVEVVKDSGLPYGFKNRFTGQKCPVLLPTGKLLWRNDYYPSAAAAEEISSKLRDALASIL